MIFSRNIIIMVLVVIFAVSVSSPFARAEKELSPQDIKKTESSLYYDWFDKAIYDRIVQYLRLGRTWKKIKHIEIPALDVNSFDEVPDSSFFTNRHGKSRMSPGEIKRGPTKGAIGPNQDKPWTVVKGKTLVKSRGFVIKDKLGDKYLLKFDPNKYPSLNTFAEVVTSKLFYAIGYNVPENSIVSISKEDLVAGDGARFYDEDGFEKDLTPEAIAKILDKIKPQPDGTYSAAASKFIEGEILGPFSLNSRRKDDPNDIIPHRRRRVIRGLKVFCSWLNQCPSSN